MTTLTGALSLAMVNSEEPQGGEMMSPDHSRPDLKWKRPGQSPYRGKCVEHTRPRESRLAIQSRRPLAQVSTRIGLPINQKPLGPPSGRPDSRTLRLSMARQGYRSSHAQRTCQVWKFYPSLYRKRWRRENHGGSWPVCCVTPRGR